MTEPEKKEEPKVKQKPTTSNVNAAQVAGDAVDAFVWWSILDGVGDLVGSILD
jgi:hypothetical protein